jgi:uncharacterized membrane protein
VTTSRLEAFSDGVLAIAVTLLVLDLHVPSIRPGVSLAHELGRQWPNFAAYAVSFATIGIIWINHHAMVRRLQAVDHTILVLNLGLLLSIGLLPFTTALMAAYLDGAHGQHLAAAIYSGSLLLMTAMFGITNRHILLRKAHLLGASFSEQDRRAILTRGLTGLAPYALATALAFVSPYATLAICGAVAAFYALPRASADSVVSAG